MANALRDLDELLDTLRRQRDMLKLKIHLARAEARDEWEELEKKWQHLSAKSAAARRRDADDVSKNVFAAAKVVAEELRRGYERIGRDL